MLRNNRCIMRVVNELEVMPRTFRGFGVRPPWTDSQRAKFKARSTRLGYPNLCLCGTRVPFDLRGECCGRGEAKRVHCVYPDLNVGLDSWYQVAWTNREYRATNQKSENTERPLSSITSTWNLTGTVRLYHNVMLAVLDCTSLVQKLELDKELGKYFNRFAQVSQVHRHDATWT
eukprot:278891-Prorocentrum_minimum.AAC.2